VRTVSDSRKCSYCDARRNTRKSLADQGWTAVLLTVGRGEESRRFTGRSCPDHHDQLMADALKFYNDNQKRLELKLLEMKL